MNLTIDIGNTSVKTAFFRGNKISSAKVHKQFNLKMLKAISGNKSGGGQGIVENVILSAVKDYPQEWKTYLQKNFRFIEVDEKTPIPIGCDYKTLATLGKDRLASAVASHALFQGKNVLAITAGTCIVYDFTDSNGVYRGGAISPGLDMRFSALHTFTSRLPLVKAGLNFKNPLGKTTEQSIRAGVQQGMLCEIEGMINTYKNNYPGIIVIVSGGSLPWLKKNLREKIISQPFLSLKGLNVILTACVAN